MQKDMWAGSGSLALLGMVQMLTPQTVSRCSLDSHLALSGFVSIFDLTQGPPRCMHLLPKMDSSARSLGGWQDILWPGTPPSSVLHTCVVWEISLTLRMRNMWLPYLYSNRVQLLPSALLLP